MAEEPTFTSQPQPAPVQSPFDTGPSPNLALGLIGGVVAAAVGAAAWAAITMITGYHLGLVAVAIGFIVGFAVRKLGNGSSLPFGITGAVLAAVGCASGYVLTAVAMTSSQAGMPFMSLLSELTFTDVRSVLVEGFRPMDGLFYAIAIYEGFKVAMVKPAGAPAAG